MSLPHEEVKKLSEQMKRKEVIDEEHKKLDLSSIGYVALEINSAILDGIFTSAELRAVADAIDRVSEKMK